MRLSIARARTRGHGRGASWSLDWENGRLARSMDSPCAAHATDGTSVVPVGALRGALTGKAAILAAAARRDASPHHQALGTKHSALGTNWDNGRPARCMGRIRTVHGTDETSVLPVKAPRASTNWDGRDAKPAT